MAVKKKENIVIYGDADLDGVTSVIILQEAIKNLGGKISAIYFPNREAEGYGITETGLNFLKDKAPALFVAVDCGIGNFKEIKSAKKIGFETIIVDHHEVLDKLPAAKIIVDPKQKSDKYSFKGLANTGISFKLSEAILGEKMSPVIRNNFLEMVALATIADMMPQEDENKIFIEDGLNNLENSWRPGIQAFFETEILNEYSNLNQKVSKIISLLNVRDAENNLPASFRLLTSQSVEDSKKLIEKLLEKSFQRKQKIEEIIREIESRLLKKQEPIIFEGAAHFEVMLISSVASTLCHRYKKPSFIYKKLEKESQGTVRTPAGINGVSLMKKCKKYLITFGGHAQASGFRVKNENLEKFKECLIDNYDL